MSRASPEETTMTMSRSWGKILAALLALGLAGCATAPATYYTKPDARPGEFERDTYECARENRYIVPGTSTTILPTMPYQPVITIPGEPRTHIDEAGFASCMASRGWREMSEPGPTSEPGPRLEDLSPAWWQSP
jgi:hypothetical protein